MEFKLSRRMLVYPLVPSEFFRLMQLKNKDSVDNIHDVNIIYAKTVLSMVRLKKSVDSSFKRLQYVHSRRDRYRNAKFKSSML